MPNGITSVPQREILSLEEICTIAAAAAKLGIRKIKVTGGEPLVRRDCCRLVGMLKAIPGIEKVTITTNGVQLAEHLDELVKNGIDAINISLDTMNRKLYERITGRDCLPQVLSAIEKAASLSIPVKINAVSIDFDGLAKEIGCPAEETGWKPLLELARKYPVDVRFIEMMPIGYGKNFKTVNHEALLEEMKGAYPEMEKDPQSHGFGPAVYYKLPGYQGSVGFISAIHGKFCRDCNRIRLTSQGYLKTCLCYEDGVDLRAILRNTEKPQNGFGHFHAAPWDEEKEEAREAAVMDAMRRAIEGKPVEHCFEHPEKMTESHNMISIGG
jgi:cyclic pyranopterin phosphate synthase